MSVYFEFCYFSSLSFPYPKVLIMRTCFCFQDNQESSIHSVLSAEFSAPLSVSSFLFSYFIHSYKQGHISSLLVLVCFFRGTQSYIYLPWNPVASCILFSQTNSDALSLLMHSTYCLININQQCIPQIASNKKVTGWTMLIKLKADVSIIKEEMFYSQYCNHFLGR